MKWTNSAAKGQQEWTNAIVDYFPIWIIFWRKWTFSNKYSIIILSNGKSKFLKWSNIKYKFMPKFWPFLASAQGPIMQILLTHFGVPAHKDQSGIKSGWMVHFLAKKWQKIIGELNIYFRIKKWVKMLID